jgi:hypothetical protein
VYEFKLQNGIDIDFNLIFAMLNSEVCGKVRKVRMIRLRGINASVMLIWSEEANCIQGERNGSV